MVNENLASIPDGWTESKTGQRGIGNAQFGSKIIYPVVKDGRTAIKLLAFGAQPYLGDFVSCDREINSAWRSIKAGDTIVFFGWFWTEPSTVGDTVYWRGANFGYDAYGSGGRIAPIFNNKGVGTPVYSGGVANWDEDCVPWGSGKWVYRQFTWVVPATVESDGAGSPVGTKIVPTAMIPWIVGDSQFVGQEGAAIYVADVGLYINPDMTLPPFATPTPTPEVYTCPFDGLTFSTQAELDAHLLAVHGQPPPVVYTCPFDGLTFSTQAELDAHLLAVHGQPPPVVYTCPFDGLTFATQAALDAHLLAVHSIPTPTPEVYTCPYDGLTFSTQAELDAHLLAVHPAPTPTPTPSASVAARVPCFGNRALVQVYLRRLRDKVFSKRAHERLHPLI